jgi:membrane protease YdiL (CAAX protease family)
MTEHEPYSGPPPTQPYAAPPPVYGPPPYGPPAYGPPPVYGSPPYRPPAYGPPPVYGPPAYGPPGPGPYWAPAPWQPPPPAVRWAPPPGTPPHDVPRTFLQAMRSRDWRWWRPLLGLLLFGVVFSVADVVVVLVAVVTRVSPDLALENLIDPVTLLVTNLTLIVGIPTVWLAWAVAHGMGTGWSSSVQARMRWRLFVPLTWRALTTLGVGVALTVVIGIGVEPDDVTGPVSGYGWLLLVVLFTTPLQSAAEEYVFRGYLSQAIAGWIKAPRAGAVLAALITATLFSLAHVPPDFLTFFDRFAFGLAASAVVWLTGGLEAAIVLHAVNNVLIFLLAGALGEAVATDDAGPGLLIVGLDVLAIAAYVVLVARSRGTLRPETHTPAVDLRFPGPAPAPAPATPRGW